jgi:hypothetical protein
MQLQRLLALTRTAYAFSSSAQKPTYFLRSMRTMPQASKKQKVEAAAAIEKSLPAAGKRSCLHLPAGDLSLGE